jgi:hypothetical protein
VQAAAHVLVLGRVDALTRVGQERVDDQQPAAGLGDEALQQGQVAR